MKPQSIALSSALTVERTPLAHQTYHPLSTNSEGSTVVVGRLHRSL